MTVPSLVTITQNNTQDIKIYGLQDADTLVFWNAAVASASLIDPFGNATIITGLPLIYTGDSLGDYVGVVTTDGSLAVGTGYRLVLDAYQGGSRFHQELPAQVVVRDF